MPARILAAMLAAWAAGGGGPSAQEIAAAPVVEPARGSVTNLPLPRFVSLRAENANARRGPGLGHRVDWEFVRPGLPLEVTAEYGHWRRVRDAEGAGGWVHHSLLSGTRTVLVRAEALTPIQAEPDPNAPVRAYAEPGVVARLEGCAEGWCEVSAGGTSGWMPRAALWGAE